jgi:hypothetical protein
VKVTAADGVTILYFNIIAKFLPTFSAWANLSKPALAGTFNIIAPEVTGAIPGSFRYSSASADVIQTTHGLAYVASVGSSVITATFTPTDDVTYSSATTTMTINVTAGDYTVGMDGPGGGKVFYVSTSAFLCGATQTAYCKFLESAPSGWNGTTEPTKLWGVTAYQSTDITGITNDGFAINTSAGIGLGLKNSIAIVSQGNDTTTAAGVARAYAGGTLNDWYLPTTAELLLMCKWARGVAWTSDETVCSGGTINLGTGDGLGAAGFVQNRYWSSSEYSTDRAWTQDYTSPGNQANNAKSDSRYVRPIRAFATRLPLFTLSSSSETRTVNIAATGFTVTSKGGAIVSFAIDAIPGGMSFNTTTGALTGTPNTVAGVTTYTVTATNSSGTSTATFALTVTGSPAKVAITRASVGTATGLAFTTQPQVAVQDSASNTLTSSSAVVSASISAGGTLVGTNTATASSGVATFSNLGVSGTVGTTYVVTYATGSLIVATVSITVTAYGIGSIGPGGGKIFYISEAGFNCGSGFTSTGSPAGGLCRYLEAAPTTGETAWTDATYAWSGITNVLMGGTSTAFGSGYKNTLAMIQQSSTINRAGTIACGYAGGGLADWYLPSKDELNQLYLNRAQVGSLGSSNFYWTSSESNSGNSWLQDFSSSFNQSAASKSSPYHVRPIRAF